MKKRRWQIADDADWRGWGANYPSGTSREVECSRRCEVTDVALEGDYLSSRKMQ